MTTKSPFKPINNSSDPFLDFMKEEANISKNTKFNEDEYGSKAINKKEEEQESFKPKIKEKQRVKPETYSIKISDVDIQIKQRNWAKLLASLHIDIFNADISMEDIESKITNILATNGIDVNTKDVSTTLRNTQERMLKLFIAKNMCYTLGMAGDWKEILDRELDLIYPERPLLGNAKKNK